MKCRAIEVIDAQHQEPAQQRPDDARLVEDASVGKGKKDAPADAAAKGIELIGKVRDDREQQQTQSVFLKASRVMVALGDEVAHDGTGEPSDGVHQKREGVHGVPRKEHPRDVVDCHGENREQL